MGDDLFVTLGVSVEMYKVCCF